MTTTLPPIRTPLPRQQQQPQPQPQSQAQVRLVEPIVSRTALARFYGSPPGGDAGSVVSDAVLRGALLVALRRARSLFAEDLVFREWSPPNTLVFANRETGDTVPVDVLCVPLTSSEDHLRFRDVCELSVRAAQYGVLPQVYAAYLAMGVDTRKAPFAVGLILQEHTEPFVLPTEEKTVALAVATAVSVPAAAAEAAAAVVTAAAAGSERVTLLREYIRQVPALMGGLQRAGLVHGGLTRLEAIRVSRVACLGRSARRPAVERLLPCFYLADMLRGELAADTDRPRLAYHSDLAAITSLHNRLDPQYRLQLPRFLATGVEGAVTPILSTTFPATLWEKCSLQVSLHDPSILGRLAVDSLPHGGRRDDIDDVDLLSQRGRTDDGDAGDLDWEARQVEQARREIMEAVRRSLSEGGRRQVEFGLPVGKGASGVAFRVSIDVCRARSGGGGGSSNAEDDRFCAVLKVTPLQTAADVADFRREVTYSRLAAEWGVGPEVYYNRVALAERPGRTVVWGLTMFERLQKLRWSWMEGSVPELPADYGEQVRRLVGTLHSRGVAHGDLHLGNIMCRRTACGSSRLYLIDYGRAGPVGEPYRRYVDTPPGTTAAEFDLALLTNLHAMLNASVDRAAAEGAAGAAAVWRRLPYLVSRERLREFLDLRQGIRRYGMTDIPAAEDDPWPVVGLSVETAGEFWKREVCQVARRAPAPSSEEAAATVPVVAATVRRVPREAGEARSEVR